MTTTEPSRLKLLFLLTPSFEAAALFPPTPRVGYASEREREIHSSFNGTVKSAGDERRETARVESVLLGINAAIALVAFA